MDDQPTPPAPAPALDVSALARELAKYLTPAAPAKPEPKVEAKPEPTAEQRATLEERLSAAERRASDAQAQAALEIWTRDVRAELADVAKGQAAVPDAMIALLRSEVVTGEDGRVRFKGADGKPRQVYDEKAKAFRDVTVADRIAELRASYPAGFVAPPAAAGTGAPGRGTVASGEPAGLDLTAQFEALKNSRIGGTINPELYLKAAAAALPLMAAHKAMIKQIGGN